MTFGTEEWSAPPLEPELVFHHRDPRVAGRPRQQVLMRALPWLTLALVLVVPMGVALILLQHAPGGWPQVWVELLKLAQKDPVKNIGWLAQMLTVPVVMWLVVHVPSRSRLVLTHDALQHLSGVPLLARWLDWRLDLNAVRAGTLKLQLAGAPFGANPLALYRVSWGRGGLHSFHPAAWHVPGQADTEPLKPRGTFGLVRWESPDNQPVLHANLLALPLVQALAARGVALPPITGKRQMHGLDLMAHPRLKPLVIGFFALIVLAVVLFVVLQDQHFFAAPTWIPLAAWGGAWALAALAWSWPEGDRPQEEGVSKYELGMPSSWLPCCSVWRARWLAPCWLWDGRG
ncbi:MAG: hypothetical protein Q4G70_05295 [Pseudomonadota bacterium]|nr:hypothetical protein [Pseudomonadota bacterium]